jgi:hypothetical protein
MSEKSIRTPFISAVAAAVGNDVKPASTIDVGIDIETEVEATRTEALTLFDVEQIESMDDDALHGLKSLLQHGHDLERWATPRKWKPLGRDSELDIDLRARIVNRLPERHRRLLADSDEMIGVARSADVTFLERSETPAQRLLAMAIGRLVRLLVLCRVGPAGVGKRAKGRPLDPSTVMSLANGELTQLISWGLSHRLDQLDQQAPSEDMRFFGHIRSEDFAGLTPSKKNRHLYQVKRLQLLADRGLWSDPTTLGEIKKGTTAVAGALETFEPEESLDTHLPLADDYVSEMGKYCHWLIRDLAPVALEVGATVRDMWQSTDDPVLSPGARAQRRDRAIRRIFAKTRWLDSSGAEIDALPFEPSASAPVFWPVTHFSHFMHVLKLIQAAHLFVVGMSMGARNSELLTLPRGCVQRSRNGLPYASGRTWKLVERHDGAERDWVLPNLAMVAIEQQERLVSMVEAIGQRTTGADDRRAQPGSHLWAEIGMGNADCTRQMMHSSTLLQRFARALGMDPNPGGQSLRVHRFRKSIARLVALAITQSPKVLQDVFGHKNIEMTLSYILTDKELQSEIERVIRELRVMKATEMVEAMVAAETEVLPALAGFGGPAATVIATAVSEHRAGLHRRGEEWGAQTARELADILTLRGKAWLMVRPGIFCTKFPGTESGTCNRSRGAPEPARCQTHCSHRLEEPFLRADVEACLREAVDAYLACKMAGNDLVQAFWAAQVKVHLERFPAVEALWKDDPIVVNALTELASPEASG